MASMPAANPAMINGKRKFCKHFKAVADREELISCYLCSMPQDGLRAGMLYLSASWICFYSKMLSKKIKVVINIPKVTSITQEKTARIIPNAIRITTDTESYVFASFVSRNNVYKKLMKLWKDTETEASDSGASDLDALQQMPPEDIQLESGTVNFQLSDSEDVSSEGSMPLAVDCAGDSRLAQWKAHASPTPSGQKHLESSASPKVTAANHSSVASPTTCDDTTGDTVQPPIVEEQAAIASEPIAASPQQHISGSGRSGATLFHWMVPVDVRGVAMHLASFSRQSIMLIITVVLCLTSTMTMYRLSILESSAAAAGPNQLTSSWLWQHKHDTASLLSSTRRSDKMIATILDSNLQMLQEIKDSLALLKTLLDRRQQPESEASSASKNQESSKVPGVQTTA